MEIFSFISNRSSIQKLVLPLLLISIANIASAQNNEQFTDPRDGKTYKTIKIGEHWIMAENLAYKPNKGNYWAYNNDSNNIFKYGYLYDWETAKNVAPPGWHLPSEQEWKKIKKEFGGKRDVFKYLGGTMEKVFKQMAPGGSGFNALPSGFRHSGGEFKGLGDVAQFWSATNAKDGPCNYIVEFKTNKTPRNIFDSKDGIAYLGAVNSPLFGKSVRLIKD